VAARVWRRRLGPIIPGAFEHERAAPGASRRHNAVKTLMDAVVLGRALIIDGRKRSATRKDTMGRLGSKTLSLLAGTALAIPMVTPTATDASPVTQYVALAYSRFSVSKDFVGYSNALASAESASLKLCRKYVKGCQGAVWVYNGWVAYASVSTARGGDGFAYGATKSFAESHALHYCVLYGGDSKCVLRTVASTSPLASRFMKGGTW